MKLERQDWKKLQTTLIVLSFVMAAVLLLLAWAQYYSSQQEQAMQAQQNLLNSAKQRYQSSGMEKETIAEYLPRYQMLISKGFVGEEHRRLHGYPIWTSTQSDRLVCVPGAYTIIDHS